MDIKKYSVTDIDDTQKQLMYDMYYTTYTSNKQEIWFNNKERLFQKYPCFLTIGNKYTEFYVMYQLMKNYNKISLICHNGTTDAKTQLMDMLSELLKSGGYILEATDAVSWVLRKKATPHFSEIEAITKALDIDLNNPKADTIEINTNFVYNENKKDNNNISIQQHIRSHIDSKSGNVYKNTDTLFGNPNISCNFTNDSCDRECIMKNEGGKIKKRKSKKKKMAKRTTKKRKNSKRTKKKKTRRF
jgi:hypothetical protein